jgi:hypothetical protein
MARGLLLRGSLDRFTTSFDVLPYTPYRVAACHRQPDTQGVDDIDDFFDNPHGVSPFPVGRLGPFGPSLRPFLKGYERFSRPAVGELLIPRGTKPYPRALTGIQAGKLPVDGNIKDAAVVYDRQVFGRGRESRPVAAGERQIRGIYSIRASIW